MRYLGNKNIFFCGFSNIVYFFWCGRLFLTILTKCSICNFRCSNEGTFGCTVNYFGWMIGKIIRKKKKYQLLFLAFVLRVQNYFGYLSLFLETHVLSTIGSVFYCSSTPKCLPIGRIIRKKKMYQLSFLAFVLRVQFFFMLFITFSLTHVLPTIGSVLYCSTTPKCLPMLSYR